ncbi:MAG: toprim domain-containing protein [Bacteroidota bacterium]
MEKIWEGAKVWIVEGPFDLFALDWALSGSNVVLSTIKAGLSKNHLRFLERFAKEVVMVYDNDKTGRKATQNALWELKNRKVNVTAYQYRGGDPGEVWDQGGEYNIKQEFKMGLFDG